MLVAELDAVGEPRKGGVGGQAVVKFIGGAAQRPGVVAVDAHVKKRAVNLAEFFERVFVIVNDLVVIRQDAENVLLQPDARGDGKAAGGEQHDRKKHRAPVRGEPQVNSRI